MARYGTEVSLMTHPRRTSRGDTNRVDNRSYANYAKFNLPYVNNPKIIPRP